MAFFSTQFNSFGLDISDNCLKLVQVDKKIKGTCIQAWGIKKINQNLIQAGEIKNIDELANEIKILKNNLKGKLTTDRVVACLPENKTFIKLLTINLPADNYLISEKKRENKKIIKELIDEELPNHIPVEIENLKYDFQIIKKNKERIKILVGATPRRLVNDYLSVLTKADLKTVALEVEAQAIARAIFYEDDITRPIKNNLFKIKKIETQGIHTCEPCIILDLGANRSSLIYWDLGAIQFTRSLDISGNQLTNQIAKQLNITYAKAEKAKIICGLNPKKGKGEIYKIINQIIGQLDTEIKKAQDYYLKFGGKNHRQLKIILTGGMANLHGLKESLNKKTRLQIKIADPLVNIKNKSHLIPKKYLSGITTAIGLGLRHTVIEDI